MSFIQLQFFLNQLSCQRKVSLPTLVWKVIGHCRQDVHIYIISEPRSDATLISAPYIRASTMFLLVCAGNLKLRKHGGF